MKPSLTGTQKTNGTLLGWVRWHRKNLFRFYLESNNNDNWTAIFGDQETAILGTSQVLIKELQQKGTPIIIFDLEEMKGNLITFDKIMKPGDRKTPLRLNILEMNLSEDVSEKVEIVTRAFKESLGLSPGQQQTLWETLRSIYRQRQTARIDDMHPAISSIITEIHRNRDPHQVSPESFILLKEMVSLAEGRAGSTLNQRDSIQIEDLLKGTTRIDLSALRDSRVKKLLASLILTSLRQVVKAQFSEEGGCNLFLIMIEAGSILEGEAEDQGLIMQTLLELKRRGVGLLIIQTFPRIAPLYLLEQCQTRICHRLTNRRDLDIAQKIFNLDETQTELLRGLSDREALVKTPDQIQPFLAWIIDPKHLQTEKNGKTPFYEEDILEIVSEVSEDGFGERFAQSAT
ncbi:ATP-binding protein [Candidatus Bathyarchaeota archaeon]|nr:ATP-binding protein [Candidatus Bathyarchaeota archaeon]